jgi:hypothetical protein
MRARRALLGPTDRERGVVEVYLIPTQVDQIRCPEAMPVGQQDHRGVAMAIPIGLSGDHELLHSASVRYSRVRSSALGRRSGVATVRFTVAGDTSFRRDFAMLSVLPLPRLFEEQTFTNSQQDACPTEPRNEGCNGRRLYAEGRDRRPTGPASVVEAGATTQGAMLACASCSKAQRPPASTSGDVAPAAAQGRPLPMPGKRRPIGEYRALWHVPSGARPPGR